MTAAAIIDQAVRASARMPRERGILFSGEMVKAILAGRKTQTRRLLNTDDVDAIRFLGCEEDRGDPRENDAVISYEDEGHSGPGLYVSCSEYPEEGSHYIRSPYGIPGDVIAVRETWAAEKRWDGCSPTEIPPGAPIHYFADGERPEWAGRTRVSIHMPAWASRLKRRLTRISAHRLQAITEEDAAAEGVVYLQGCWWSFGTPFSTARAAFSNLWNHINGARAPWEEDPWVLALAFEPLDPSTAHPKGT